MGKSEARSGRSTKRQQILQTGERLFSRFGAKRVSIEELCREASVSKMTFYKYFANKAELIRTIRDNWIDLGFKRFDEINAMQLPFPEKIDLMTRWEVEFSSRINTEFIREVLSTEDVEKRFKQGYIGNITRAQEVGEIRSDIDPQFLWLVQKKLGELFREEGWKNVPMEFDQFQEQLRNLLYFGLLTREEDRK
jgi:AcrR family transcriptional regulator